MKYPFLFKITTLIVVLSCCSWGFLAHKTIHQIAIYSLPKKLQIFFFKNVDYLVYNSVRPDVRRKDDPSEATKHFIDIDAPVFGKNSLVIFTHFYGIIFVAIAISKNSKFH